MARIRTSESCADTPRARWDEAADGLDYLLEIRHLAGKRGTDIRALPLTVVAPFHDTRQVNARFEDNLAVLLDSRFWDLNKLQQRGDTDTKPRVDLFLEINAMGNLSLDWWPRGCIGRSYSEDTDFLNWGGPQLNDRIQQGRRPGNEILFIRGVSSLAREDRSFKWSTIAEEYVLFAVRATVNRIVRFLSRFLDLRMINDFHFELDEHATLKSWEIGNVAARWARSLPGRFGLSLDDFIAGLKACETPDGSSKPERICVYFGETHGNTVLTPVSAAALLEEYERYRAWPKVATRVR
jgi:hypothetical protein